MQQREECPYGFAALPAAVDSVGVGVVAAPRIRVVCWRDKIHHTTSPHRRLARVAMVGALEQQRKQQRVHALTVEQLRQILRQIHED